MKIGDYVNVALVDGTHGESRQGVYVRDNSDGTIQVQGEDGNYQCSTKKGIVIPDSYLFSDTLEFVKAVRRQLGI
jgi:hypothetical protein